MLLPIQQNLTREQGDTYSLVLSAVGIAHQIHQEEAGRAIWVDEADEAAARLHIEKYEAENRQPLPDASSETARIQFADGAIVALLLLLLHMLVSPNQHHFIERYGASAAKILSGEIYRTATALLLHSDAVHLVGNMAGITLFGAVVCSINGYGLGWLLILFSAMLGNGLNAHLHQALHMSIGASTAVFSAVGLLAAHQFWRKIQQPGQRVKAWLPMAGGIALLAMLGTGAGRVDVMAHLFGFVCGFAIQILYQTLLWIESRTELPPSQQPTCLWAAIFIMGISILWPLLR
ncbi:rhomboid family intramembrane serine protease [Desulfatitalea alkaliphila]|uniref:Rhomboid family intramembrane serine protease n=1 Tax=Desulfatitalea alkaliphila TaxID=2929485 RepID=A0AA41R777_9BACT|nr:rhomboid family intramembrane serine protease [Desulfatitalea alkaliphila]MCJ8502196.1 rhomboid family intramembrane serine protease [Desulfatitalea alkaliphila]